MRTIQIGNIRIGPNLPLALLSGPCVIESEDHTLHCAKRLVEITSRFSLSLVFKASYDKANRTSLHSFRGPGIEKGLKILERVQREFGLPVVTDVHTPEEALLAAEVCDMIQIPAFLCRQTDLLMAAGKTKAAINIKKGQFLSPWDMEHPIEKLTHFGNHNLLVTERGASFGYQNLVSDMRSIPILQKFGFPVCFDASHSVQLPGGLGSSSGGQREFIPTLARAAIAAGANALFLETHPTPASAKSDAATVFPLDQLESLLFDLTRIYSVVQCSEESRLSPSPSS